MKTDLLACPLTHQPLRAAPPALLADVNAAIAQLALRDATGSLVRAPLDAGLLRADGAVLYPVRGGVAVLFAGAGIAVSASAAPPAGQ